jgi:hypothetical protein
VATNREIFFRAPGPGMVGGGTSSPLSPYGEEEWRRLRELGSFSMHDKLKPYDRLVN